ncbi:hypothetical protein VTJ83DRAFT_5421 [Remersonia thermophila]|uniref:SET domain-containing protein n=1 Tax=Remersonia thermophila TaxID=72144 RepID=A0ABR4D8Z4_9PEZI
MTTKPKARSRNPAPLKLPDNWPPNVSYLLRPSYSPYLAPSHLAALRTPPDPSNRDPLPTIPQHFPRGPCPAVRIVPITDPNHPACGQAGLFAARDLAPGELILPYLGEVHVGTFPFGRSRGEKAAAVDTRHDNEKKEKEDGEEEEVQEDDYDYATSDYDLWIDRDADLAVDAARMGNEARFINDYRGVPCQPPRQQRSAADGPDGGNGGSKNKNRKGKHSGGSSKRSSAKPAPGPATRTKPNAEFRVAWDARTHERCMAVFVLRAGKRAAEDEVGIREGDEILLSYGKGFWSERRETAAEEQTAAATRGTTDGR